MFQSQHRDKDQIEKNTRTLETTFSRGFEIIVYKQDNGAEGVHGWQPTHCKKLSAHDLDAEIPCENKCLYTIGNH